MTSRTLRRIAATVFVAAGCDSPAAPKIPSGIYYAYEPISNRSGEEDPNAQWFHAHEMTIRGRMVIDHLYPVYFTGDEGLAFSASDGGFYLHAGTIETRGGRTVFHMQVMECDYCGIPTREGADPQEYFLEVHEYVATSVGEHGFELDHLRFSTERDPRFERH